MPTYVAPHWDIFRMRRGGIRAECWQDGCDWLRDFDEVDDKHWPKHLKQIRIALQTHLRHEHGIEVNAQKMRFFE